AGRGKTQEIPELAEGEAGRGHQEDGYVSAAAVRQERKEQLGEDEDREHPHDRARGDQLQQVQGAPSGSRGWVVLSELRWVPCLGSPSPVERAFGRLSGLRGPVFSNVGQAAHGRSPSGASPYYEAGLLGGTT